MRVTLGFVRGGEFVGQLNYFQLFIRIVLHVDTSRQYAKSKGLFLFCLQTSVCSPIVCRPNDSDDRFSFTIVWHASSGFYSYL
jgi:hypothetical protein